MGELGIVAEIFKVGGGFGLGIIAALLFLREVMRRRNGNGNGHSSKNSGQLTPEDWEQRITRIVVTAMQESRQAETQILSSIATSQLTLSQNMIEVSTLVKSMQALLFQQLRGI